jgi:hypothetical protein
MRCVSQPVSGIDTALAAANTVINHVPSSTDTPRPPEIFGIATFAIDVSSTVIKVASATAMVARTSWPPLRGGAGTDAKPMEMNTLLSCGGNSWSPGR